MWYNLWLAILFAFYCGLVTKIYNYFSVSTILTEVGAGVFGLVVGFILISLFRRKHI